MDLREIFCENGDWFQLAQYKVQLLAFEITFGFYKSREFVNQLRNCLFFKKDLYHGVRLVGDFEMFSILSLSLPAQEPG
jgi:hypothetical protein